MATEDLRAVFDEDPELYERARPGYPSPLFAELSQLARVGKGARVAEIGPGTGQATRTLAAGGATVVAVELGAGLADQLRRQVAGLPVEVHVGAFETWAPPTEPFDTVVAFTAWHWLDPGVRAAKVWAALKPGGALATVTTTHVRGGTEQFFDDVQDCYERWDPATPPGLRTVVAEQIPPAEDEVDSSALFEPAVRRRFQADVTYSAQGYLDVLTTYSGHRAMEPERRVGLLACIGRLIDTHYGGVITKRYLYELRVARRSG